jgi:hypothetical protein
VSYRRDFALSSWDSVCCTETLVFSLGVDKTLGRIDVDAIIR